MINNHKIGFVFLSAVLVLVIIIVGHTISAKVALRKHDATRLVSFIHRIANTDRIVGTFDDSKVSSTITGKDLQKIIQVVASASSHRPPSGTTWQMAYSVKAVFYKGINVLGDIEIGEDLFLVDESENPPFQDNTGFLKDLVSIPAYNAFGQTISNSPATR
jgi:hypothetical protein